jgi:hypothetical protein
MRLDRRMFIKVANTMSLLCRRYFAMSRIQSGCCRDLEHFGFFMLCEVFDIDTHTLPSEVLY